MRRLYTSHVVSHAYDTRRGRGTEYDILERSSLNTGTVESPDGELVELGQDIVASRMLGDVPHDAAAQSCLGRMDGEAHV